VRAWDGDATARDSRRLGWAALWCRSRGWRVAVPGLDGGIRPVAQQAEAQYIGEAVLDAIRRARIVDAFGEAPRHAEALLDLTQRKQAAIGREGTAVEAGEDRLAGDR
jgi:hypothetical protein